MADESRERGRQGRRVCFAKGLQNAGEGFESSGSRLSLRTMGNLTCNHCRPEVPFGPIVGGFHAIFAEEAQQVPAVLLRARPVQQSLIIHISQCTVAQEVGEFVIQGFGLPAVIFQPHFRTAR